MGPSALSGEAVAPACCEAAAVEICLPDAVSIRGLMEPMSIPGDVLDAEIIAVVKRISRRPIEPTPQSDLALDLGFDSLLLFELIAELEDRFDVSIPLNDVEAIRTVAQVGLHVRELIDQRTDPR